jgi:ParB family transcriptional regulator, chromosome partitioning protein
MNIPIDKIFPNPDQPRKVFDKENLEALAQSIRENGVVQAITVEEGENGYVLVDGERRLRASKLAGLTEIPSTVNLHSNGSGKRLLQAMVANLQREDLNPIEEALAYQRLQQEFGLSVEKIALKIGKCGKIIHDRLLLLKLDEDIQKLIAGDALSRDSRLANGLLKITDKSARVQTAKEIALRKVKVTTALRICERVLQASPPKSDTFTTEPPSVSIAKTRYRSRETRTDWDILKQLGKVPPWQVVLDAAIKTCDNCGLRPVASKQECSQCPAVELLWRMLEVGAP